MLGKNIITCLSIGYVLLASSQSLFAYEMKINCGGGDYTAQNGEFYAADRKYSAENGSGYTGGASSMTNGSIDGTEDNVLYQSERWGDFSYSFDVPGGFYRVKLRFAETYFSEAGRRVFDVYMENSRKMDDFDIYALTGWYHAIDYEFTIRVEDGQLNLTFSSTTDFPKLNAVEVTSTAMQVKPPSTGPVRVSGRQILVNDEPFFIKGAGYQPVPIGKWVGEYDIFADPEIYNRDFPLLRELNCNTIRTWAKVTSGEFLDAAYNNGANPIYVIMGFFVNNSLDLAEPSVRKGIIEEFKDYVGRYKDKPAVLMWAIGNEQNYWQSGDIRNWYTLINEMAWAAYEVEGETYHPVTTPNGDIWNETGPIGNPEFKTDDISMAYLDVWGANIYSGWSFQGRLQNYHELSSKPFWVSEYGFPGTNQRNQAEGAYVLWDEIAANVDVCSGGTIMAYSDEWWKSGFPERHDSSNGEEFWGLLSVEDSGEEPDIMHRKLTYSTLKEKWATSGKRNLASGKECRASSEENAYDYKAGNAMDGDYSTRWSSEFSDPQWIYVDLGGVYDVGQVILRWEAAYAVSYKIQKSPDGKKWIDVYETTSGDGTDDYIAFDDHFKARYVRIYGFERATQWGYSLWELEIMGRKSECRPLKRVLSREILIKRRLFEFLKTHKTSKKLKKLILSYLFHSRQE